VIAFALVAAFATGGNFAINAVLIAALAYGLAGQFAGRKRAEATLAQMALADGRTGLPNRRQFDAVLDREWRLAVRDRVSLALLMIDVDNFKAYNDDYGHVQGDDVLKSIACAIGANGVRPRDLAARYGGAAFAVILPGADTPKAIVVAERIRVAIEALGIPHAGSPHVIVSVSIGVASIVPSAQSRTLLIEVADHALDEAKNSGRNRIVVAPPVDVVWPSPAAGAAGADAAGAPPSSAPVNRQIRS